jgi:metallo-beta-lactamase family protein
MRIQFCGADRTVTGSCHLIETQGVRLLLDCGMYQGPREEANEFNQWLPYDVRHIDAVILSHGHLDHCGKLPVLTRAGYTGPIYCTPATAEVARIVLEDSAKIQEENADYLNTRARDPREKEIQPLYNHKDVHDVMKLFRRVPYGQRTEVTSRRGEGASGKPAFTYFDAGHILGSAYIWFETVDNGALRKLLFTADVGRYNTPILRDPQDLPGAADWVITESTYGNKQHGSIDQIEPQFLECVKTCIAKRSRLLVPSFAVGRTQTVLWYMQKLITEKQIPPTRVYVDSPMGVDISRITCDFPQNYDEQSQQMVKVLGSFCNSQVMFASSTDQSRQINNDRGPCVIVASSPTCEFGRILHHLKQSVENPNDMILFVGWIPPQTLGRRLQDGQKRVRILDRWYDVRCQVRTIHGLSAHADGDELLRFLKPTLVPTARAFVVHGEVDQAEGFARRLLQSGIGSAIVPAKESSVFTSADAPAPVANVSPNRTDND